MRCVIHHLNKYWKKIDWDQIQSGQINPLPEQFEVVLFAYRPEAVISSLKPAATGTKHFSMM